jgi:hypothetical protein
MREVSTQRRRRSKVLDTADLPPSPMNGIYFVGILLNRKP